MGGLTGACPDPAARTRPPGPGCPDPAARTRLPGPGRPDPAARTRLPGPGSTVTSGRGPSSCPFSHPLPATR